MWWLTSVLAIGLIVTSAWSFAEHVRAKSLEARASEWLVNAQASNAQLIAEQNRNTRLRQLLVDAEDKAEVSVSVKVDADKAKAELREIIDLAREASKALIATEGAKHHPPARRRKVAKA